MPYSSLDRSLIGKVPMGEPRGGIEVFTARHHEDHAWYYYPAMTSEEVLIWKGYDSDEEPMAPPLHYSFDDPNTPLGAPERESVEVRVFCLLPKS